jgi:hypothetical protein
MLHKVSQIGFWSRNMDLVTPTGGWQVSILADWSVPVGLSERATLVDLVDACTQTSEEMLEIKAVK